MNFNFIKFCTILADKQLSITDVSLKSKLDAGTISRYTNGKIKPCPKSIGKLAKALNDNINELID